LLLALLVSPRRSRLMPVRANALRALPVEHRTAVILRHV
jgi:hypothetical protein